ncbi:MAG: histidine--tRNA ligase [SAR202 cluster bacterium]|nr:histidine--tRNA ligase [SAR202 cluster bacterium]
MFKAARGTKDILPEEQKYWRYVERVASTLAHRSGFRRLDTPVFEDAGLFQRSVGTGTDIMDKEVYLFEDRGGDKLTLRPEGTAPVCRAYLEHGMHSLPQPVRLYYFCPVFRYDRPQAGRYRQHHQFGVEVLGDGDALVDAEVVQLAWSLMANLGLKDVSLVVNSIGDAQCRPGYIKELQAYYRGHFDKLCGDCKARLENNPLRLLDCKKPACQPLQESAPKSSEHLCEACRAHWEQFKGYMAALGISYSVDHKLVRGLDYYTRTVFEILPPVEGAQSTLLGGGRYDGLMEQLDGRPTPGVGFATGMERLILNLQRQEVAVPDEEKPKYMLAAMTPEAAQAGVRLAARIRERGAGVVMGGQGRSMRSQMRSANSMGVPYVVILGEDELKAGTVTVKDMASGEQRKVGEGEFLGGV